MAAGISACPLEVAELQGLYGAFTFPEKLLQKIWLRGDFNRAASVTMTGSRVRIVHPGKWNLLGGPDFAGARVRFDDGSEMTGDVELHLRAEDWDAHGHAADPAYDRVLLHVVLFPPEGRKAVTAGGAGRDIPVLALLPLLHRALEEYAADEAVELLANRAAARLPDELGTLPKTELAALLGRHADARWRQKVHFARVRIERLGWPAACHHAALEILGYRFNRAPMLRIAGEWSLARWADGTVDVALLYQSEKGGWGLQGVRPANHPLARLRQYAAWTRTRPDWPTEITELVADLRAASAQPGETTGEVRRRARYTALRLHLGDRVCGAVIGGTRLENILCDGVLPLLAAKTGEELASVWFHWFAGDLPPLITGGLRQLGFYDGRAQPACHGAAQGLLGWLLEREARH